MLKQANFRLPVEQHEWLRLFARQQHLSQSDVVRMAIDSFRRKADELPFVLTERTDAGSAQGRATTR